MKTSNNDNKTTSSTTTPSSVEQSLEHSSTSGIFLLPYAKRSKGAKRFAKELGIKRIKRDPETSSFKASDDEVVINWGNSTKNLPEHLSAVSIDNWVNPPQAVDLSVDKIATFEMLERYGYEAVEHTRHPHLALKWLEEGETVIAREDVRGMKGKGMSVMMDMDDFVIAPLYTLYLEHQAEVRVHVAFGEAIEVLDKTANGFISQATGGDYAVDEAMLSSIAVDVITDMGLDFGAVDFLWTNNPKWQDGEATILEVNCAPEMKDGTLKAYADTFRGVFGIEEATPLEKVEAILNGDEKTETSSQNGGKTSGKTSGKTTSGKTTPIGKTSPNGDEGKSSESVGVNMDKESSGKTSQQTTGKSSAKVSSVESAEVPLGAPESSPKTSSVNTEGVAPSECESALDELTELSEELGMYEVEYDGDDVAYWLHMAYDMLDVAQDALIEAEKAIFKSK